MEQKNSIKDMGDFCVNCPHCGDIVYITKINCAMFLHAANKNTFKTLNAHAKWYEVDKLKRQGILLGCGKRFWIKIDEYRTIYTVKKLEKSHS